MQAFYEKKNSSETKEFFSCRRWESNPHTRRYTILSRARLPVPPLRLVAEVYSQCPLLVKHPGAKASRCHDQTQKGVLIKSKRPPKNPGGRLIFVLTLACKRQNYQIQAKLAYLHKCPPAAPHPLLEGRCHSLSPATDHRYTKKVLCQCS